MPALAPLTPPLPLPPPLPPVLVPAPPPTFDVLPETPALEPAVPALEPPLPAAGGDPDGVTHAPSRHSSPLPQSESRKHAAPPQPPSVVTLQVANVLTSTAPVSRLEIDIDAQGDESPKKD